MLQNYIAPALQLKAFNCPHCMAYAKQEWGRMSAGNFGPYGGTSWDCKKFMVSQCESCNEPSIWLSDLMVYPDHAFAELPNADLPEDIKQDYNEARSILNKSPRGAAALLRLSIQKLCKSLGESGANINNDIKALVVRGLPPKVQESLDSVRVIGNEAVHPGELDLRDDRDTAAKLFRLVNFIATKMISEPKEIDEIYNGLPQDKRDAIKQRDSK